MHTIGYNSIFTCYGEKKKHTHRKKKPKPERMNKSKCSLVKTNIISKKMRLKEKQNKLQQRTKNTLVTSNKKKNINKTHSKLTSLKQQGEKKIKTLNLLHLT